MQQFWGVSSHWEFLTDFHLPKVMNVGLSSKDCKNEELFRELEKIIIMNERGEREGK